MSLGFKTAAVCICEGHRVSGSVRCNAVLVLNAHRQKSNKHIFGKLECLVLTVYTDHTVYTLQGNKVTSVKSNDC